MARAVQVFRDQRAGLFLARFVPQFDTNQAGYERLEAGQNKDAIELFKSNAEVYPTSANANYSWVMRVPRRRPQRRWRCASG